MGRPVVLRHPSSAEHDTGPGHPERAERIVALEGALREREWLGWEVRESPAATDAQLHAVHPPAYVERIEELCARGGGWIDADTVVVEASGRAARHAAGGAVALVDALLAGDAPTGASLHRPPGHHAERARAMGFCLFDNVAVAAQHALDAHGLERVMVVDWDVHHGNGTNAIFADRDDVLFLSIHQSPLYPGTGAERDVGTGAGEGYSVNLPVPAGSGDETFVSLVEHVAVPLLAAYDPGLLLISAGYDAHADDPLAGCRVTDEGYAAMARALRDAAAAAGIRAGLVLEGGYDLGALTRGTIATLEALAGAPGSGRDAPTPVHPLARAAQERLAWRWEGAFA